MFLPTTQRELTELGWCRPDIILITGDAYIDSPNIGVAVIGKVLLDAGYKVAIIAQPDIQSERDITRLGEPLLFWGITSGCTDSLVANYTSLKKPRKMDDLTPGGRNVLRPDRALIAYTNLIRKYFKKACPIILGGIDASLRRISHYDFLDNSIRRSILFDAKADLLVYGMGERAILEIAGKLKSGDSIDGIRGTCQAGHKVPDGYIELPEHAKVAADPKIFAGMFLLFYANTDPVSASGLFQKQDTRYLIHHPPAKDLNQKELDHVYGLNYERNAHPFYSNMGEIRALDTIRFSVTTHRGCYGECGFCAITAHQGRCVISRSAESIESEIHSFFNYPDFKGIVSDVGGPTANMYGMDCSRKRKKGACKNRRCLFPVICEELSVSHRRQIDLLKRLRSISGIKKIFIRSGLRHDLVVEDIKYGRLYLETLLAHHISGQLKIAPEHSEEEVLALMGKPGPASLVAFKRLFDSLRRKTGARVFLTYYFIAAHPGCCTKHMIQLQHYVEKHLKITPEQVQIFTPTPSTLSTLMYMTGINPVSGEKIFVETSDREKQNQKRVLSRYPGDKRLRKKYPVG